MYADKAVPLVSVIMPAYNAAPFIEEAIYSVIGQTVTDWELFVIDDGSSDESFQIAQKLASDDSRIHVLQNAENMGVAKTRNRGIELAKGEYIAFLDSDDIWHPEKIERQLIKMRASGAGMSYCSYRIIGRSGDKVKADYLVPETAEFKDILKENYIQCSAMLIRQDLVKRFLFNTVFFHEDYILGLDILRTGETAVGCTETLLSWRYLDGSRSFNKAKAAVNRWKIYRNYLGLTLGKTLALFLNYAAAGIRKYFK